MMTASWPDIVVIALFIPLAMQRDATKANWEKGRRKIPHLVVYGVSARSQGFLSKRDTGYDGMYYCEMQRARA